jgi:hypothetical protein
MNTASNERRLKRVNNIMFCGVLLFSLVLLVFILFPYYYFGFYKLFPDFYAHLPNAWNGIPILYDNAVYYISGCSRALQVILICFSAGYLMTMQRTRSNSDKVMVLIMYLCNVALFRFIYVSDYLNLSLE